MPQFISKPIGIDLGTTNSAVAIMNLTDTEIILHRDEKSKRETTPSCVWRENSAAPIIVGHKALGRIGGQPRPIRSIKRHMGRPVTVDFSGERASPEKISSHVLTEMIRQIKEDAAKLDTPESTWTIDRAIVTVPAYFDQPAFDATRRAADMAGLQTIELLAEPTAAACYYCWRTNTRNGVFLVYDLGGGTFDVSLVRCTDGTLSVLGIAGNNLLGGDDLDAAIAEQLRDRLQQEGYDLQLKPEEDPEDVIRWDVLKVLAEQVKVSLSTADSFILRDQGRLRDKQNRPVMIETLFDRGDVESWMRPVIERTLPKCDEAVEKAKIGLGAVDAIILVGGSTHVPLVREMVRQKLCADPSSAEPRARCAQPYYDQTKVDTIVALGAALRAAMIGGVTVTNAEKTVRISFLGGAISRTTTIVVSGKVEFLKPEAQPAHPAVRLLSEQTGEETVDLNPDGSFVFNNVELPAEGVTQFQFEIIDSGSGRVLATASRQITHSREDRPTPKTTVQLNRLTKALAIEVVRAGVRTRKVLVEELAGLPANERYTFTHPGNTETIRLPLYQRRKKIKEVRVSVPYTTPKGTPIELTVKIDAKLLITVMGSVGEQKFDTRVEVPPERTVPTDADFAALQKSFAEAAQYLPPGKRYVLTPLFTKAGERFKAAVAQRDSQVAVHEFEEMEAMVDDISIAANVLQPPKDFFNDLVRECTECVSLAKEVEKVIERSLDSDTWQQNIDAQRKRGEEAFAARSQKGYSDAIVMLQNHIDTMRRSLAPHVRSIVSGMSAGERLQGNLSGADDDMSRVESLALSKADTRFQSEIAGLKDELRALRAKASIDPQATSEKCSSIRRELDQIKDRILRGNDAVGDGTLAVVND